MFSNSNKAIIISGPSGAGKTTAVQHLLRNNAILGFSVSACTRPKRSRETHGKDYYFLSVSEFRRKIEQEAFVEWEEVYKGNYYGTLKTEVERLWKAGKIVVFDVSVRWGLQLKSYLKEQALAIYVQAPSIQSLANRLESRAANSKESTALRMNKAEQEADLSAQFDVVLVNNHLQTFLKNAQKILDEFLAK